MSWIIFFDFFTKLVVDVILLQIGLKCFSMRMTLDLLHEYANTEVSCLFHNCMWQSRHSEVNVYFLALREQTDGLSTFNVSHRAYLFCVNVFVCVFVFISEGRSRRDQKQRSQCAWNMKMTLGWMETQTWAGLSRTVCVHLTRKTVKRTMTLTDNKEERLTTKNEGSSMHDGSCIGINYAHRFPKCFRSFHTLLGFRTLCFVSSVEFLSLYLFTQFLTCTRIPWRDSHCENGLVRCCLYTPRRLQ